MVWVWALVMVHPVVNSSMVYCNKSLLSFENNRRGGPCIFKSGFPADIGFV